MRKRGFKICAALMMLTLAMGTTSMAANPSYSFSLKNNGQVYTRSVSSKNTKVYKSQNWSLNVTSIGFSQGVKGYGASFIPLNSGNKKGGNPHWRSSQGATWGTYGSYGGAKGT